MPDSGGNHNDVAGLNRKISSLFAAQPNSRCSLKNTQNFVANAVIVVKGIDAVPPGVGPIIGRELLSYLKCRILTPETDSATI